MSKKRVVRWGRDLVLESWLESEGISYRFLEHIPLSSITERANYQSRSETGASGVNKENVERYIPSMAKADTIWPAVIVGKLLKGKYPLLQGNQRIYSARRVKNCSFVSAYEILTLDEDKIWSVVMECNQLNGDPLSKEERLAAASDTKEKFPTRTLVDIAKQFCLDVKHLGCHLRGEMISLELAELGVDASRLGHSHLIKLYPLRSHEEAYRQTGSLLVDYNLTAGQLDELVAALGRKKSDVTRLDLLKVRGEELDREVKGRGKRGKLAQKIRTERALASLTNELRRAPSLPEIGVLTQEEIGRFQKQAEELSDLLSEVFEI